MEASGMRQPIRGHHKGKGQPLSQDGWPSLLSRLQDLGTKSKGRVLWHTTQETKKLKPRIPNRDAEPDAAPNLLKPPRSGGPPGPGGSG
jgi:hypothetical protein